MMKRIIILFSFALLVMINGSVFAQDLPTSNWWKDPSVIQKLNLDEQKIEQLDDLHTKSYANFSDLRNNVENAQNELKTLLESKNFDEEAVMRQVTKLEKERSELNVERVRLIVKMRQILGYDAFNSLKETVEKRTKERNARRRNGQRGNRDQQSPDASATEKKER